MATERNLPDVGEEIHLPGPSAQPLMLAVCSTVALIGVTQEAPVFFVVGISGVLITLYRWIRDAVIEFKALPDHHGDHSHDAHGGPHVEKTDAAGATPGH